MGHSIITAVNFFKKLRQLSKVQILRNNKHCRSPCCLQVHFSPMDCRNVSENCKELPEPCSHSSTLPLSGSSTNSCSSSLTGQRAGALGRPAAANAARERSRVQTLRHAFLELQRTLPSVPPDTKLSKLDVLLLATTYIAHLTRSLQDEEELPGESLGTLRGDGYLHPVKVSCAEKSKVMALIRPHQIRT